MKKSLLFVFCVMFAPFTVRAQAGAWQPAPGYAQMPLWPGTPPDAQPMAGPEQTLLVDDKPVAAR